MAAPSYMDCAEILQDPCLGSLEVQGDPDIAGIGVLLSFLVSAGFAILLAIIAYHLGLIPEDMLTEYDRHFMRIRSRFPEHWRHVFEKTVLAFSDLQLITGIAILVAGFTRLGGMPIPATGSDQGISVYHWQVVVQLAWLSSNVHLTTLTFLRFTIRNNPMMRTLRIGGMLVLACLLLAAMVPTLSFAWSESLASDVNPVSRSSGGGTCDASYALQVPSRCYWDLVRSMTVTPLQTDDETQSRNLAIRKLSAVNPDSVFAMAFLIVSYSWKIIGLSKRSYKNLSRSFHYLTTEPWKGLIQKLDSCRKETRGNIGRVLSVCRWMSMGTYIILLALTSFLESFAGALWIQSTAFVWATMRLVQPRKLLPDSALATESLWNFGQILPLLLLVLPLFSIAEGLIRPKEVRLVFRDNESPIPGGKQPCEDTVFILPARRVIPTTLEEVWASSGKCHSSLVAIQKALGSDLRSNCGSSDSTYASSVRNKIYGSGTFKTILVSLNLLLLYGVITIFIHGLEIPTFQWCGSPLFPGLGVCGLWCLALLSGLWSRLYKLEFDYTGL